MSDFFHQPKMSEVCIRSNLHIVLHFFPFNLICNMTFLRKKVLTFLTPSGGCRCKRAEYLLHCVLCFIPVNLTCNLTTFIKDKNDLLTTGIKGMCMGKTFASMLVNSSFPLILQHDHILKKFIFI